MSYSRDRDETCFRLCKMQARLFERSSVEGMPSYFFVKSFVATQYARKMDELTIFDEVYSEDEIFQNVKKRINIRRGTVYSPAVMHWIGYLLREWSYRYNTYTSLILKDVSLDYLAGVYQPYHSLDVLKAIKLIAIDRGINLDITPEERLRKILLKTMPNF